MMRAVRRSGGSRAALLQRRDHLTGEQAGLLAGEGLDEQPPHAGRVESLLEGADDLVGGAGDRDGRPVLAGGSGVGVELAVGRGDGSAAASVVQRVPMSSLSAAMGRTSYASACERRELR